jgi:signal transduction histidine kinase
MTVRGPRIAALLLAIGGISLLHYLTPTTEPLLHVIYQRSYYLPILFAAFWFGRRGGSLTAALVAALYLPHVFFHWRHETTYQMVQLTEILMLFAIGTVAGSLSARELRQKRRYMQAKEELEIAYRELRDTFDRLRLADRLASLGTLAAGMAHEIKNPLASISGSLEILERELGDRGREHEFFAILQKEIARLTRIVDKYLEFARPLPPQRSESNMNDLVRSVVELTGKQAGQDGIAIEASYADSMPEVVVDGEQIRQAVLNLVLNAIQAMPERGTVTVSTEFTGGEAICRVRDRGPGIGRDDPHRIFDPFFTTKPGGTGLGLPIAYRLIEQHGGRIDASNHAEGGAQFSIHLPIRVGEGRNAGTPGSGG